MISTLSVVTIIVEDQDDAIEFYTGRLGFELRSDEPFGPGRRWVTVAPPDQTEVEIHLQGPNPELHGEAGAERLREQVGRNPAWSFTTDDCAGTFEALRSEGVTFVSEPAERPYGIEAGFEDLYGNRFSLLEPTG
jgi:catechol 2,3-dioxygenase-like lactoylglutathione lyase family enzyme